MTRLSRMCATALAAGLMFAGLMFAGLVFAAQANADSPWTEFTVTENFPCLGEPEDQDDLAVISGVETSNNGVGIWHVTVDPDPPRDSRTIRLSRSMRRTRPSTMAAKTSCVCGSLRGPWTARTSSPSISASI